MTELILLLATLIGAAFFSGTETAFIAANRVRLEMFERKGVFGAALANHYFARIDKALAATLVGRALFATLFATLLSGLFADWFGRNSILVDTLIAALLLSLVADVVAKPIFRELADYAVLVCAPLLRLARITLFPFIVVSEWAARQFANAFGATLPSPTEFYRKQDFEVLLRENALVEARQQDVEILSNALAIGEIRVRESMVPRTEIVAIEKSASVKETLQRFETSGYSRLPVYDGTIDKIVGVVAVQDLFKKPKSLESVIKEVMFVPETKKAVELLSEFLQTGQSLAIVVDEFGGTAGLITAEDLIEELVGDIQDEYDQDDEVFRALSENTYLLSGRLEIDRINEKFGLSIPKGDYETLAGYILANCGRIPKQGEVIEIEPFTITISKASKTKIDVVKLTRKASAPRKP
ncbi:MAG: hemolysin family protein [Chloroherpetonaceae bacterium]|nr:hemolysin family protein [Chloroherpetonaceae bacterium]MDW8438571.1 hemolysin family protein [Chloroherpetonaceae bacterium]